MNVQSLPAIAIQRSEERAFFDKGWLQTYHSFSFADYFDPANLSWGALRVFNDDVIAAGKGFPTHPHRDMEILTYVLEGELEHKDSMGNIGVISPGGVQYLSAGTGIKHSEYNHSSENPLHLVQMWVLPRAQGLEPRYGQVEYTLADRLDRWLPIATGEADVTSRIALWQDGTAYVARLEDKPLNFTLRPNRSGFLFVAGGEIALNGETLGAGDAARLAGPLELALTGKGEVVLWDVPSLENARV
jgi:quercetin 2,3-dioxygenase